MFKEAVALGAVLYGSASDGPRPRESWDCSISSVQTCTEVGCQVTNKPNLFLTIYPKEGIYARCKILESGSPRCESYSATFGNFNKSMLVMLPPSPQQTRVFSDLTVQEVSSAQGSVAIAFGKCEEGKFPVVVRPK